MEPSDELREFGRIWEWFADSSCRGYSPLYDRICRFVAQDDDVLALIKQAPPAAHQPNVILGVVHYLLLGGLDHPLAAVYAGRNDADPGPLFRDVCLSCRAEVLALMQTRRTQTNEVGRSAVLGPALTWVAGQVRGPLALVDVGTSAGLNLACDRYRLDYGAAGATGPPDADVRIACAVIGGNPPIAAQLPAIVARIGLDRSPIDLTDERDARWLLACIWPDTGRLERTSAAIRHAQQHPPTIRRGDMIDDLPATLAELPDDATVCVLTTWALAYLQSEGRQRFAARLAAAGRQRTIVWISGEGPGVVSAFADAIPPPDGGVEPSVLGAVVYDGDTAHATALAYVHPHGASINWLA
ncbi:MAG: DUF2332 domain-containing protein [Acidimicrobiia bacterium]